MAAIWVDSIERDFLEKRLEDLIKNKNIKGAVFNPVRFFHALTQKGVYAESIGNLQGKSPRDICETLIIEDARRACDIFMELYDKGDDGFVCIEPGCGHKNGQKKIIDKALRLRDAVERENLMINIPASDMGYAAMKELAKRGLNLNAIHVFSPNQAARCAEALSALPGNAEGVISVNVSRFDAELNALMATARLSKDRVGFFNAIKIHNQLRERNLPNVRVLFASTDIHQPWLETDYYIKQLNLPHSVISVSPETAGQIADTDIDDSFEFQTKHIDAFLSYLTPVNISLQQTYEKLFKEEIQNSEKTYENILSLLTGE